MSHGECFSRAASPYDTQPARLPQKFFDAVQPLLEAESGDLRLFQCSAYERCTFSCGGVSVGGMFKVLAVNGACLEKTTLEQLSSDIDSE